MVVSNVFYFHPYLGKIPILTNIFQMGWDYQPDIYTLCTIHYKTNTNRFQGHVVVLKNPSLASLALVIWLKNLVVMTMRHVLQPVVTWFANFFGSSGVPYVAVWGVKEHCYPALSWTSIGMKLNIIAECMSPDSAWSLMTLEVVENSTWIQNILYVRIENIR